jgi:dihydrofolate reductase
MKNKVILYISMTLDWFISRIDWKVDFLDKYQNSWEDFWYSDFMKWVWSIIMWNTTYKEFWDNPEFDEFYKDYSLFIYSNSKQKNFKNIEFINWDISENLEEISKKNDKNIWLLWWAKIFNSFLEKDLVDELIITIMPEIIWEWIALFKTNISKNFKFKKSENFKMWVVQLTYEK